MLFPAQVYLWHEFTRLLVVSTIVIDYAAGKTDFQPLLMSGRLDFQPKAVGARRDAPARPVCIWPRLRRTTCFLANFVLAKFQFQFQHEFAVRQFLAVISLLMLIPNSIS